MFWEGTLGLGIISSRAPIVFFFGARRRRTQRATTRSEGQRLDRGIFRSGTNSPQCSPSACSEICKTRSQSSVASAGSVRTPQRMRVQTLDKLRRRLHVYMHVCTHVYTNVCSHACAHVHEHTSRHTPKQMSTRMSVHMSMHMCTDMSTHLARLRTGSSQSPAATSALMDMCVGMCTDMSVDMYTDMCMDMWSPASSAACAWHACVRACHAHVRAWHSYAYACVHVRMCVWVLMRACMAFVRVCMRARVRACEPVDTRACRRACLQFLIELVHRAFFRRHQTRRDYSRFRSVDTSILMHTDTCIGMCLLRLPIDRFCRAGRSGIRRSHTTWRIC